MSSALYMGSIVGHAGVVSYPAQRGRFANMSMGSFSRQSLPADPVGVFLLTLTNLVVGSAVHIEAIGGPVLASLAADASTEVIPLQAYAAGSALNNLRIKVRKGSASPYYQPWETLATAIVGSQSIYVSQIPDE